MFRPLLTNRYSLFLLAVVFVNLTVASVLAAEKTWVGNATPFWTDGINWSPSGAPGINDTAILPQGASRLSPILLADGAVLMLDFTDNSADPYSINGTKTLTLQSGDLIARAGGLTHQINCNLALGSAGDWQTLGATNLNVNGSIGGSFGFEKLGSGTLALNGVNTLTGDVIITQGTLDVGHSNALQDAAVELKTGGKLTFSASAANIGSLSGNGVLFVTVPLNVGSNDDDFTYSGQIINTFDNNDYAQPIRKYGTGAWTLSGSNDFNRGNFTVVEGTLVLQTSLATWIGNVLTLEPGTTLTGRGGVQSFVSNGATIAPGYPLGTLFMNRDAALNQSMVQIELGGTTADVNHDLLDSYGTFQLTETDLTVSYANGFIASPGDEFVIVESYELIGAFESVTFPDGQGWSVNYDYANNEITLRVCGAIGDDCNTNGVPDECDPDSDGDGVPDDCDACPGFNDNGPDGDGDGVVNACDVCTGDDASGDSDADGICDDVDACPGFDDGGPDDDGDGVINDCDYCASTNTGDRDGDGDIDFDDFFGFDECVKGPNVPVTGGCDCFDIDTNGFVTLKDYAELQRMFTGDLIYEPPGSVSVTNMINNVSDKGLMMFGEESDDLAGFSVAFIDDLNGDGLHEMLIGAPSAGKGLNAQRGRAYVVYGKSDLSNLSLADVAAGIGGFALDGEHSGLNLRYPILEPGKGYAIPSATDGGPDGEGAGFAVASAGDVNGDGVGDMLISAPYAPVDDEIWGGRTYVVFGGVPSDPAMISSLGVVTAPGSGTGYMVEGERGICPGCPGPPTATNGDLAGWSVDGARDMNGDGLADMMMGSRTFRTYDYGRAYAVYGKEDDASVSLATLLDDNGFEGMILDSVQNDFTYFGRRVQSAGDYTADGLSDMLTIPAIINLAYVVHGQEGSADLDVTNTQSGAGYTTANAGDYDCDEFICTGRTFFGLPTAGGGDFNGDGRSDVVLTAANHELGSTDIMIVFGSDDPWIDIDARFGPASSVTLPDRGVRIFSFVWDSFEFADLETPLSIAGDLNGDGFDDLVVGGLNSTWVIFGRTGSWASYLNYLDTPEERLLIFGGSDASERGWSVDSAGDANGDGLADLLIGAPRDDSSALNSGATFLVYGDDFTGAITHRGDATDNTLDGTTAADNMVGGAGHDTHNGNGGVDTMYGGAGDDIMVVSDTNFRRIRGGTGFDTLKLSGGLTLDLEAQRGRIDEIEQIDLSASGADTLSVRRLDLLNLSPTSNQLFVIGTNEDQVMSTGDDWVNEGIVDFGGINFVKLQEGRAELFVQESVNLKISPTIVTRALSVVENSPFDTSLGFIEANDPDGGSIVNFTIVGGDGQSAFTLDATTGELLVDTKLNFEAKSVYTLEIQVTDNSGDFSVRDVVINVICVNEAPVWVQEQYTPMLMEHEPARTLVGTFRATDQDTNDVLTYVIDIADASLTSPALPGAFAIDASTGDLTVGDGSFLDWETSPTQELIVYAVDSNGLKTPASPVSITLQDVQTWNAPISSSFKTTNASMWSTDGSVGASPLMFEKFIDASQDPTQSFTILGQEISVNVKGQFNFEAQITTDAGSVSADISFVAELALPDEVELGQAFDIQLSWEAPLREPQLFGTTPAADFDMLLELTNFKVLTTIYDFGPYDGSNTGGEYFSTSVPQAWFATAQPNGDLVTDNTIVTTLLELAPIDWDSYLLNFISYAGLPSNEGRLENIISFGLDFTIDYILWAFETSGSVRVEQDLSLEVDGYDVEMTLENGDIVPLTLDVLTSITLPLGADTNNDGFVEFEIRVDIDTTFSNYSNFIGSMMPRLTMGYLDVTATTAACVGCPTARTTFGPVVDAISSIDVGSDAVGFGTPWPAGETGQFPLGGFNTIVLTGAFDLAD